MQNMNMYDREMSWKPLGFGFHPTKEELISGYLEPYVKGLPLPWDGVVHKALYSAAPWDVFNDGDGCYWQQTITEGGDSNKNSSHVYVFTKLIRAKGSRISRTAGGGTWGGQTGPKKIVDPQSKETIGNWRMLSFEHPNGGAESEYGHWIMHEYVLSDSKLKTISNAAAKDYAICKITKIFKNSNNSGGGLPHQPPQPQFIPPAITDSQMQFIPPQANVDSQMQFFPPVNDNFQTQFYPATIVPVTDNFQTQFYPAVIVEGGNFPSKKRAAEEDQETSFKKQKLMGGEEVCIPEAEDDSWLVSALEDPFPELEKGDDEALAWMKSAIDFENIEVPCGGASKAVTSLDPFAMATSDWD